MILCSKWKNGLCKIVTKSQVVTKFNVTKSRLHCISNIMSFKFFRYETVETHALAFLTHIISAIGGVFVLLLFTLGWYHFWALLWNLVNDEFANFGYYVFRLLKWCWWYLQSSGSALDTTQGRQKRGGGGIGCTCSLPPPLHCLLRVTL